MHSIFSLLVICTIIGTICAFVAKGRGRHPFAWFAIGSTIGLLGLLLLLLLPRKKMPPQQDESKLAPVKAMSSEAASPADDGQNFSPTPRANYRIRADLSTNWYYIHIHDSNKYEVCGPMTVDDLRKVFVQHSLPLTTYIWCDEFPDWIQLSDVQNPGYLTDPELIVDNMFKKTQTGKENSPENPDSETREQKES